MPLFFYPFNHSAPAWEEQKKSFFSSIATNENELFFHNIISYCFHFFCLHSFHFIFMLNSRFLAFFPFLFFFTLPYVLSHSDAPMLIFEVRTHQIMKTVYKMPSVELDGMTHFLREKLIDCYWWMEWGGVALEWKWAEL